MKNFSIYRASAGSGKTYTLTYNYIKLALSFPDNFKSILAVTFTNKAMEEMKSRIITTLRELSDGKHSMSADLMESLNVGDDELKKRSKDLLTNILHNYSFFAVSTIDTFFQKVVRSFAREIGIHSGFKIELDQGKVLSDVVDKMIADMASDQQLVKWLTQFAIHQINNGKSWDTKRDIKGLANELFKEQIVLRKKVIFEKIEEPDFMESFMTSVFEKKAAFEDQYQSLGKTAVDMMEKHGLSMTDFTYGGTGVAGYFVKVSQGEVVKGGARVMNALEQGKWASAKSPVMAAIDSALGDGLDLAVANMVSFYDDNIVEYNTLVQASNYLYTFGLLARVEEEINNYREEKELLLISDFPVFLNEIINESDSPYVYEKIGTRYKHYLIDEFQDTSGLQWNNFKPLIQDSLSAGNFNMVVGDIKQSIYRWRGGNWKILLEQIKNDIGAEYTDEQSLATNRRSKENIVAFNNDLFSAAPVLLEKHLKPKVEAYSDVLKIGDAYQKAEQNLYDESGEGLIDLLFIDKKEEEEAEDVINTRLIQNLQELQDHNYSLSDITILVRTNGEGRSIAQALMDYQRSNTTQKYRYDVISNESLFLKNNPAINVIIQVLRLVLDPSDMLCRGQLNYAYKHYRHDSEYVADLVDNYINVAANKVNNTLVGVIDHVIDYFDLYSEQKDIAYLMAFQDTVQDYLQFDSDSVSSFLDWWEDHGNRSVQMSGEQDAITIMTVHKSKGLQFKAVLMPYCSWSMDHSGGFREQLLWCETAISKGLNAVPLLPLKYKSPMVDTAFARDYLVEKNDIYLDNLNLLYVALTRAEEVLYLTCTYSSKVKPGISTVAELLLEFAGSKPLNEKNELRIGSIPVFSTYPKEDKSSFEIMSKSGTQSNHDRLGFRTVSNILGEEQQRSIDYGDIVHWIFSQIRTEKDFSKAMDRAVLKFSLLESELNDIKLLLRQVWDLPAVSNWFNDEWDIKNESSILLENGKMKRPDRVILKGDKAVVIDYKTGNKSNAHLKQVSDYKKILGGMGYSNIEGYLLYISLPEVVKV